MPFRKIEDFTLALLYALHVIKTFCKVENCLKMSKHILNEISKPPVNKTQFFNIAHLLLNCLK